MTSLLLLLLLASLMLKLLIVYESSLAFSVMSFISFLLVFD